MRLAYMRSVGRSSTKMNRCLEDQDNACSIIEHIGSACDDVELELLKVLHNSLCLTQRWNSSTNKG